MATKVTALKIRWFENPQPYAPMWQAMQDWTRQRQATTDDEIWLLQHHPVYTLGQAGDPAHILAASDIPIERCDRGGQVTYHGPGQIVAYVLVDLRRAGLFVRDFVWRLEQAVINTLEHYGLDSITRNPGAPGVYVPLHTNPAQLAKIAALGVKVRQGCTYHGVALNVDMDLGPFNVINPCGYAGLPTVDLASYHIHKSPYQVGHDLAQQLQQLLEHQS